MFVATTPSAVDKTSAYADYERQLASLLSGERDFIANAANMSALIFTLLPDLNWAGFYLLRGNELVLGPFQGKPACVRIPVLPAPRGVCGNAAFHRRTFLVPNVHAFPGHIACDSASNSEIVLPIIANDRLVGVLDLDSPTLNRFDADDQAGLERMVATFVSATDF
ncbi:MAG: GAF domain-containing protein [Burkholderiales bacterium]|jgi:GAF domain-containing protein|nr:GAF domain-containing protein [Nitrosomonadaceae bacterium]